MGDWIKNNKFEALLLLGVIIVAVGAFLFGSGKDRLYEEAKGTYGQHRQSVMGLKGKKPYPTPASATEFELQIDAYEEVQSVQRFSPKLRLGPGSNHRPTQDD